MIAILQRVTSASVETKNYKQSIKSGYLIYLGISHDDNSSELEKLVQKIIKLRIFRGGGKSINQAIKKGDQILVISQFTLLANLKNGNRPSFTNAAKPKKAKKLYQDFIDTLSQHITVKFGIFGSDMKITSINDGPVTIILDTQKL